MQSSPARLVRGDKRMASPEEEQNTHDQDLGLEQFETAPDDHGLSLDELSSAYAQLMGQGEVPFDATSAEEDEGEAGEQEPEEEEEDQEETDEGDLHCELSPSSIVEAILFLGHPENTPMQAAEIARLMRGVQAQEIDGIVCELNETYETERCAYHIVSDEAGYRLVLRPELAPLREKFYGKVREAKLTQAAVDVLAIVAYNEGCTRDRIEEMRGKPCSGILPRWFVVSC